MPHAIRVSIEMPAVAHAIIKRACIPQHILDCLPDPPEGPPPAFADRSTWIQSLEPWRRQKVRKAEDTESTDNAAAASAAVIDEEPISTTGFPYSLAQSDPRRLSAFRDPGSGRSCSGSPPRIGSSSSVCSSCLSSPRSPYQSYCQSFTSPVDSEPSGRSSSLPDSGRDADDESGEFAECDSLSNPSEAGPFEEFALHSHWTDVGSPASVRQALVDAPHVISAAAEDVTASHTIETTSGVDPSVEFCAIPNELGQAQPPPSPQSTPAQPIMSATPEFRKTAEHLSDWVANYIWRVVTTGANLDSNYMSFHFGNAKTFPPHPPAYLADAIKACLLSTLIQPPAIFLAIWYIVRLPVYFGEAAYEAESPAYHFRRVLLGESVVPFGSFEKQSLELFAPFKLFVNGVLLASKMLDDNTFSNKTWHEVSRIQIRDINSLELYSLDLLNYDLSVPHDAWIQWLISLRGQHVSLAPYPAPIGPAKDTPHGIILRLLDGLIAARSPSISSGSLAEPIFLGIEERIKERGAAHPEERVDTDFDLDDDGPIRDEYKQSRRQVDVSAERDREDKQRKMKELEQKLPPPAIWSPAADPPIVRTRPKYVAVERPHNSSEFHPLFMVSEPTHHPPAPISHPLFDSYPRYTYDHISFPRPIAFNPYFAPYPFTEARDLAYPHTRQPYWSTGAGLHA